MTQEGTGTHGSAEQSEDACPEPQVGGFERPQLYKGLSDIENSCLTFLRDYQDPDNGFVPQIAVVTFVQFVCGRAHGLRVNGR